MLFRSDLSYLNLDWKPVPIISKFVKFSTFFKISSGFIKIPTKTGIDDKLANSCQSLRNHGLSSDPLHASEELHQVRTDERLVSLGHSFRLSEVHAAVGATQMKRIDEIMERRGRVADWYTQRLGGVGDVMCPTIDPQISMSWDGYVIRLNDQFEQEDRDHIIRGLHRHEIGAADYFRPVSEDYKTPYPT